MKKCSTRGSGITVQPPTACTAPARERGCWAAAEEEALRPPSRAALSGPTPATRRGGPRLLSPVAWEARQGAVGASGRGYAARRAHRKWRRRKGRHVFVSPHFDPRARGAGSCCRSRRRRRARVCPTPDNPSGLLLSAALGEAVGRLGACTAAAAAPLWRACLRRAARRRCRPRGTAKSWHLRARRGGTARARAAGERARSWACRTSSQVCPPPNAALARDAAALRSPPGAPGPEQAT